MTSTDITLGYVIFHATLLCCKATLFLVPRVVVVEELYLLLDSQDISLVR